MSILGAQNEIGTTVDLRAQKILKGEALAPGWVKCSHGAFNPDTGLGCAACVRAYWEEQLSKSGLALSQLNHKQFGHEPTIEATTPCPKCGSSAHFASGEYRKVECADCGHKYEWKASLDEGRETR